jgi:UDP:flavonoid glycosyltransferase YjiC (YdhE family)
MGRVYQVYRRVPGPAMHAILATLGTDGDVVPHLGLGEKLRARGHRVTLAAPEPYQPLAARLGLDFRPLASAAEAARMLADPDLWHPLRSGLMMARWGGPMIPRQYDLLADLARDPTSVLVVNPGVLAARLVRDTLGRPTATLLLQPGLLPSTTAPPAMPAGLTLPPGLPRRLGAAYWAAVDAAGYLLASRPLNRARRALGLAPVRRVFRWWLSPDLVIGLFPGWYAAPQPDWPPQLRLAGFGRYDGGPGGGLPDDLRAFCAAGEPPIAFTLGTGLAHGAAFFRAAVRACAVIGARGLLLTRYPGRLSARLPPSVRHVPFAPFRQLLPLCRAVVHHGGVGTTAAALAAGTPQLVLPLAWDQPDNAARVRRLGRGEFLSPRRRTAGPLARALGRVLAAGVRDRCRVVAARAGADEDGLDVAARWVEGLVGRAPAEDPPPG